MKPRDFMYAGSCQPPAWLIKSDPPRRALIATLYPESLLRRGPDATITTQVNPRGLPHGGLQGRRQGRLAATLGRRELDVRGPSPAVMSSGPSPYQADTREDTPSTGLPAR